MSLITFSKIALILIKAFWSVFTLPELSKIEFVLIVFKVIRLNAAKRIVAFHMHPAIRLESFQ